MDTLVENLEDAGRRDNGKILYLRVNKLKDSSQSGLLPFKDREGL